jgi:DNA-binding transcriptional ArsR family regulator
MFGLLLETTGRTPATRRTGGSTGLEQRAVRPRFTIRRWAILNQVAQYPQVLDRTFSALADAHRRKILDRLSDGPVSITELAVPLGMSLPGVLKHVRALEAAQLVVTDKQGRTRWCRLGDRPLDDAAAWIDERRTLWARRLDRFDASLEDASR